MNYHQFRRLNKKIIIHLNKLNNNIIKKKKIIKMTLILIMSKKNLRILQNKQIIKLKIKNYLLVVD